MMEAKKSPAFLREDPLDTGRDDAERGDVLTENGGYHDKDVFGREEDHAVCARERLAQA